ncbi:hypothetical protein AXE65_10780 [Ventosimonas gracilis]|uniref:BrnA antitoxin family protein n=1 Tax=Ventosimonas gracilis TaxID=1680762 RepID=A0A139SWK6_9GAMM|nr:BrnA antitoxin family protein [Ventosimonas gracilis]KXU39016.1 hypothetical protein AXE65_10780 [Ventosimonas gracilis]
MPALKPNHIFVTDEEDAAITAAAMSDPDALPWTDEQLEAARPFMRIGVRPVGRPPLEVTRPKVTLRLEPPVLEHLRASGKGWQTRVNALLREAVEQGRI